ncbi:hypothetical protein STEG23_030197 [Scotinomys teguina]
MAWTLVASIFVPPEPSAVGGCRRRWAADESALLFPPWPRLSLPKAAMPQFQTWEEFSRAAEKLYLADPMKVSRWRHGPGAGVFSAFGAALAHPGSSACPRTRLTEPSVSFRLTGGPVKLGQYPQAEPFPQRRTLRTPGNA